MNFTVKGTFHSHKVAERQKKDGTGTFVAGDVLFGIDNSYINKKDNAEVFKIDLVPFNVYGATAEKVLTLTTGEEMEITFSLEGTEYNDKNYPRIKAAFIHHPKDSGAKQPLKVQDKKDEDIPF